MPITEAQRIERKQWLGSSDVAAVLGISPWKSAFDVWLDKTGRLEEEPGGSAADAGNRFEPAILDWASEHLGPLQGAETCHAAGLPIASNLDSRVRTTGRPVEAKSAGLFSPLSKDWGDFGTDEIPGMYIIQCQVHLLCTTQDLCHVPAFLGGRGFGMYDVPRDESLVRVITDRCVDFWERCVKRGIPPADSTVSLEIAKRVRRDPNKVCQLPIDAVQNWIEANEARKAAEKVEDATKAVLLTCLGDAEAGDSPLGRIVYPEYATSSIDVKHLREKLPAVASEFTRTTKYRTLRLKAARVQ